jgi:hypothetical protein
VYFLLYSSLTLPGTEFNLEPVVLTTLNDCYKVALLWLAVRKWQMEDEGTEQIYRED